MTKLTIDDIADLRAYERERDDFRAAIIALKKRRRVAVGPIVTLVFENRDTIRFQIQEMARAEKILTDEAIQAELDIYNPLIPEPGSSSATLFIELTSDERAREWLPKLVGIESSVELRMGPQDPQRVVRCVVDADHLKQLTRRNHGICPLCPFHPGPRSRQCLRRRPGHARHHAPELPAWH